MKKNVILFVFFFYSLFPLEAQLRQQAFNQAVDPVVRKALPSVAALFSPSSSNTLLGYGFAVDSTHLMTHFDNILIQTEEGLYPFNKVLLRSSRRKFVEATLVSYDEFNRVALFRFPVELGLKPVKWAKSAPQVGDLVLSIGITLDVLGAGMLSAISRNVQEKPDINPVPGISGFWNGANRYSKPRRFQKVLQHDLNLEINHLGSPLVNLEGEVVGLNVSKFIRGTNYAISSDTLEKILPQLRKGENLKEPTSGRLGIRIVPVSAKDRINYGIKIVDVVPGSAAEKGGLKAGDILLTFNGETLREPDSLVEHVSSKEPGTKANLVVLRNNREVELPIVIGRSD